MMDYNKRAKDIINESKPLFTKLDSISSDLENYPNKLEGQFYLSVQDTLSNIYNDLLENYLKVKGMAKNAEALAILAMKKQHEGDKKRPTVKELDAEARVQNTDVNTAESLLEARVKSVKNYLQTCRSHIAVITSRESENEGDK
jgi:hypothetical protein